MEFKQRHNSGYNYGAGTKYSGTDIEPQRHNNTPHYSLGLILGALFAIFNGFFHSPGKIRSASDKAATFIDSLSKVWEKKDGHPRQIYGQYLQPLVSQQIPFTRNSLFKSGNNKERKDQNAIELRSLFQTYTVLPDILPDSIYNSANATGDFLYFGNNTEFDPDDARRHKAIVSELKCFKDSSKIHRALNIVGYYKSGPSCVLHHIYIDGTKSISTFRSLSEISRSDLRMVLTDIASLSDTGTLAIVINKETSITRQLQNIFTNQGKRLLIQNGSFKPGWRQHFERIDAALSSHISLAAITLVSGIPLSIEAHKAQSLPLSTFGELKSLHDSLHRLLGKTSQAPYSKDEFIRELQTGTNDVVIVSTHSDGKSIYLNDEEVTLKELGQLPIRDNRSPRPRVFILATCYAGNLKRLDLSSKGKSLPPLGQLLIDKNFADLVIAPDNTLTVEKTYDLIHQILAGASVSQIQVMNAKTIWHQMVFNLRTNLYLTQKIFLYESTHHHEG